MNMTIDALAEKAGVRVLAPGRGENHLVKDIYASRLMSELLGKVSDSTLLITPLAGPSVLRLVELMDVPAICLVNGIEPDAALLDAAREYQTALLVSPEGMDATVARFRRLMEPE